MSAGLWAAVSLVVAGAPAVLYLLNRLVFRAPDSAGDGPLPQVSILIPARNEESSIDSAIACALATRGATIEVVVLDDQSTDRTAQIVRSWGVLDARVRLEQAPPLPAGWCGKQHACQVLAERAAFPYLLFQDADVRLRPQAVSRLVAFLDRQEAGLVSGFPRQITGTWMEKMVIPLIHFVLLGFLPIWLMRRLMDPAFGTACGQLMLTTSDAYWKAGGHARIKSSLHDGITLPPVFRRAGLKTDLCDITDLADCRMYRSAREVWNGLAKNATEGMGSARRLPVFTLLLFLGQVLPWILIGMTGGAARSVAAAAALVGLGMRCSLAISFRQSWFGAILHPAGVAILLAIQWYALVRKWLGLPAVWKSRTYEPVPPPAYREKTA